MTDDIRAMTIEVLEKVGWPEGLSLLADTIGSQPWEVTVERSYINDRGENEPYCEWPKVGDDIAEAIIMRHLLEKHARQDAPPEADVLYVTVGTSSRVSAEVVDEWAVTLVKVFNDADDLFTNLIRAMHYIHCEVTT